MLQNNWSPPTMADWPLVLQTRSGESNSLGQNLTGGRPFIENYLASGLPRMPIHHFTGNVKDARFTQRLGAMISSAFQRLRVLKYSVTNISPANPGQISIKQKGGRLDIR